jgi:hypothetical protein
MHGKAKIQSLTNAWYGYTFLAALVNVVRALSGSVVGAALGVIIVACFFLFSIFVTWSVGKLLLARSGLTRVLVLVLSSVGFCLGVMGIWSFISGPWTTTAAVNGLLTGCGMWMQLRTVKTLLDRDVKSYFA